MEEKDFFSNESVEGVTLNSGSPDLLGPVFIQTLTSANMVSHRSTKGASKARRDHINHEIRKMRSLLPVTHDDQERLSYLHSMAAICTYIRKSVLLRGESANFSHTFYNF